MTENDPQLEELLLRYRPCDPPADLRRRALSTPPSHRAASGKFDWAFRSAIAAMLILAGRLNMMANQMNRSTAANIGTGPIAWSAEAEEAAKLVDGTEASRQYLALCLLGSSGRDALGNPTYEKGRDVQ